LKILTPLMTHRYHIKIHGLYIAPEHKVFGKGAEDLSGRDLLSKSKIKLIADSGIEGDRFCRLRPDYNGHVTFFSREVWDEVSNILYLPETMGPEITRRNIIVSGVDLKLLYGAPFTIQNIQFLGTIHCAPCPAMNRAISAEATTALRSRGGLRAQVKTSGVLNIGPADLITDVLFDPQNASTQIPLTKLP
jgi:MOSC domain-containing protein YiiM